MKLDQIPAQAAVLIYGYGKEGQSSKAWLKRQRPAAKFTVYQDVPGADSPDWSSFDLIVKSPGVPPASIPAQFHAKITSNWRLFTENLTDSQRQKLIGITGSKGKSTTAKFTHELLQKAGLSSTIIGNYGVPALEAWHQLDELDYIVAECSSFQLYDSTVSPHYALFLSFFADHLDWHDGSKTDYFAAKQNLWRYQSNEDWLFVPKKTSRALLEKEGLKNVSEEVSLFKGNLEGFVQTDSVPTKFFPPDSILQAEHFRQNLGAAWALAQTLKIPDLASVWQQSAAEFEMIEHRLEKFLEISGWSFYNDSIATSPDATIKGVEFLGAQLSGLILDGEDAELEGCKTLAQTLEAVAPQARVALLESDITNQFLTTGFTGQTKRFNDYETALNWLLQGAPGAILLSPGGKSFNRFKNYTERGRVFKELVHSLY